MADLQEQHRTYGYCHCGCGEKTGIAEENRPSRGEVKGAPRLFKRGHNRRSEALLAAQRTHRDRWESETVVPYGYCWCGCGAETALARDTEGNNVCGCPVRFLRGHNAHKVAPNAPDYLIEDRGYETPCWI